MESKLELLVGLRLKALNIKFVTEYKFHPIRRWRFDFALLEEKIAIECEGGVWTGGRHTRGAGFVKDIEKYNTATTMGWKILRYTMSNMDSLEAELRGILLGD